MPEFTQDEITTAEELLTEVLVNALTCKPHLRDRCIVVYVARACRQHATLHYAEHAHIERSSSDLLDAHKFVADA